MSENKKVVITGCASGIGYATTRYFADRGFEVHGIDINEHFDKPKYWNFTFYKADVSFWVDLPSIDDVNILINNAGVQTPENDCIRVNLEGLINTTEAYAFQDCIESVVNLASVSAHNGAEFPYYTASKGGVLAYTKWCAKILAQRFRATCNSISFGGVLTNLNDPVLEDDKMFKEIMDMTPLRKWCTAEEAAEWIYFLTVMNKSCTGQDIIVDNGEFYNHKFVWPDPNADMEEKIYGK